MNATADPSRRFVLPEAHPYLVNLAALWSADPKLAAAVEALPDDSAYPVAPAKDGNLTVSVSSVLLHSRYRPAEEASKLLADIDYDKKLVFFLHGLGLGYHVEQLFEAASSEAVLCIFEPDLRLIRTTLWHRDLSKLIRTRRVFILNSADKAEFFNRIAESMALVITGRQTIRHAPSVQLHPGFFAEADRWAEEYASFAQTSLNTLVLNGRRTAENVSRNVGWYVATPGVDRLKGRYKDKPAVIVSAGPSLRKNVHLLKGLEESACIIAVQTTLQPLIEMGVEPHFVTSLDYHDISTRFFEKLPKNLRTELVAEPKASKLVFGLHPGPVTLLGNDFAERLLKEMSLKKGTLPAGATVAHLAFYLAEHLGCNPVIFLGQDLGFSDGLCYAPGTSYEDVWRPELSRFMTVEMKQWEQIVRERHILRRVPDHLGRPTYTEERLFTYLQQFERDFLSTKTKVIDSTEGGVLKRGAEPMPFAQATAGYVPSGSETVTRLSDHPGQNWSRVEEARRCIVNRKSDAEQIEQIANSTLPLLEGVRDNLHDQGKVNHLIAQIDDLRARMNALGDVYELIIQLTQTTELQRFRRDRAIAASKAKGEDRQRQQVTRDIENVRAIAAASKEFRSLMDEVLAELESHGSTGVPPVTKSPSTKDGHP